MGLLVSQSACTGRTEIRFPANSLADLARTHFLYRPVFVPDLTHLVQRVSPQLPRIQIPRLQVVLRRPHEANRCQASLQLHPCFRTLLPTIARRQPAEKANGKTFRLIAFS